MTEPKQEPTHDPDAAAGADADAEWAAAMAEQASKTAPGNQAAGLGQSTDDWASALAEQTAATPAAQQVFQPLADSAARSDSDSDIDMIMDIPVQLTVELGRTRLTIKNILQLGQGSVIELDGLAGEPMDIFVNGYLIAQGEVVVVDEKYGIRLTDIITPSDRIHRLNNRR